VTSKRYLALALALACSPAGSGEWVAEVDGRKISLEALERSLASLDETASAEAREEALVRELDRLLRERVILNRAEELGVRVREEEVDALVARLSDDDRVRTDPHYRAEVERDILMDRVALLELTPELDVPESEVALRLEEERAQQGATTRVEVRQIVVSDPTKARRLLRELREGAEFEALAREHSLGPEAKNGGLLPPFAPAELPEAFDVAFKLRKGELSDVVESPHGFHIFRLERRIEEPPLDPEAHREKVREELRQERFVTLRESWARTLREKAEIRINEKALESLR
jgi:parvulin-like peptidyl-prolyl isomerase